MFVNIFYNFVQFHDNHLYYRFVITSVKYSVKQSQYSSSFKYVDGRPFNTPSFSIRTMFKRALEITFFIQDLTIPTKRS